MNLGQRLERFVQRFDESLAGVPLVGEKDKDGKSTSKPHPSETTDGSVAGSRDRIAGEHRETAAVGMALGQQIRLQESRAREQENLKAAEQRKEATLPMVLSVSSTVSDKDIDFLDWNDQPSDDEIDSEVADAQERKELIRIQKRWTQQQNSSKKMLQQMYASSLSETLVPSGQRTGTALSLPPQTSDSITGTGNGHMDEKHDIPVTSIPSQSFPASTIDGISSTGQMVSDVFVTPQSSFASTVVASTQLNDTAGAKGGDDGSGFAAGSQPGKGHVLTAPPRMTTAAELDDIDELLEVKKKRGGTGEQGVASIPRPEANRRREVSGDKTWGITYTAPVRNDFISSTNIDGTSGIQGRAWRQDAGGPRRSKDRPLLASSAKPVSEATRTNSRHSTSEDHSVPIGGRVGKAEPVSSFRVPRYRTASEVIEDALADLPEEPGPNPDIVKFDELMSEEDRKNMPAKPGEGDWLQFSIAPIVDPIVDAAITCRSCIYSWYIGMSAQRRMMRRWLRATLATCCCCCTADSSFHKQAGDAATL